MGQGESAVCARFQVEVVTSPERESSFGLLPSEEWSWLHRKVTGPVDNSEERIYRKDRDGYEPMHDSWWRNPTSGEIHRGVSSFRRMEEYDSD